MTLQEVKAWVVKKATVTKPYKKQWSASVTLGGMDINETGESIEKAYSALAYLIFNSKHYSSNLENLLRR